MAFYLTVVEWERICRSGSGWWDEYCDSIHRLLWRSIPVKSSASCLKIPYVTVSAWDGCRFLGKMQELFMSDAYFHDLDLLTEENRVTRQLKPVALCRGILAVPTLGGLATVSSSQPLLPDETVRGLVLKAICFRRAAFRFCV